MHGLARIGLLFIINLCSQIFINLLQKKTGRAKTEQHILIQPDQFDIEKIVTEQTEVTSEKPILYSIYHKNFVKINLSVRSYKP